jgi:hypothetical protein
MCHRSVGIHHLGCVYQCVGRIGPKFSSFFEVVFCHVGNPYVGVSEEYGDDVSFPAGIRKFWLFCGCSVRVVFLVLLFFCLISKKVLHLLAGYV